MEQVVQQFLGSKGTDLDLKHQFTLYEVSVAPVGSDRAPCPMAAGRGSGGMVGLTCPPVRSTERSQARGWCGRAALGGTQGPEENR